MKKNQLIRCRFAIARQVLLAASLCVPVISRAVTMITSVPYTISVPGAYELGSNLTSNDSDAILVKASNVSIDLAGYTITGASGKYTGIFIFPATSNVSVQNGTINGFYGGIHALGLGHRLTNLWVFNATVGVGVEANNSAVENCFIVGPANNSPQPPAGIYINNCGAVLLRNNQVTECYYGVWEYSVTAPSVLVGNYEANCTYGLNLNPTAGTKYQGNITTNCATPVSAGIAVGHENG